LKKAKLRDKPDSPRAPPDATLIDASIKERKSQELLSNVAKMDSNQLNLFAQNLKSHSPEDLDWLSSIKTDGDKTLLHCLCSNSHIVVETLKAILSILKFNVDAKDSKGWSPLHYASCQVSQTTIPT